MKQISLTVDEAHILRVVAEITAVRLDESLSGVTVNHLLEAEYDGEYVVPTIDVVHATEMNEEYVCMGLNDLIEKGCLKSGISPYEEQGVSINETGLRTVVSAQEQKKPVESDAILPPSENHVRRSP